MPLGFRRFLSSLEQDLEYPLGEFEDLVIDRVNLPCLPAVLAPDS